VLECGPRHDGEAHEATGIHHANRRRNLAARGTHAAASNDAEGKAIWDAVVEAAMSRLRPILTVLGLIPIAPTIFWGPMSYPIMGGLLVAPVLTLIFLPARYVAWFRVKEPVIAA
jgi:Cu/Ag efflux pump CusA